MVVALSLALGALTIIGAQISAEAATTLNLNYAELNFDYASHTNITAGVNCVDSTANCVGKNQGDAVLFTNVATVDGTVIDALVTTSALVNSTIGRYEVGASAGGSNSYFQVDSAVTATGGTRPSLSISTSMAPTLGRRISSLCRTCK